MANFGGASRGFIKSKVGSGGSGGSAVPAIFTRGEGGFADLAPSTGTTFRIGRRWYTDFSSSTLDATQFNISGFTYGTDGTIPVVTLTTGATKGTIYTKAADVKDVDIRVKWRGVASTGFTIGSIDLRAIGRYMNDSNQVYTYHNLDPAARYFNANSLVNNSVQAAVTSPTAWIDGTNTTTYRYTRLRLLQDIMYIKHWFEGSAEPDWQYIGRVKITDNTSAGDMIDIGQAGVTAQYGGTIQEIQINELIRTDTNLLFNSTINQGIANQTADNNYPVGWVIDTTMTSPNAVTTVQDVDPWGITRSLFRLDKTVSQGANSGVFWTQYLYDSNRLGGDVFGSRRKQYPQVEFPNYVEVSIWSKASNLQFNLGDGTGPLGVVVDIYFYDKDGNILNVGTNYYHTLGPNGSITGASGRVTGTWDWFQTRWRTTFKAGQVKSLRYQVGFHDDNQTGTLWFCDPVIRGIG